MLSGILNSDKAIAMNIAIMRSFVEIRKIIIHENNLKTQLKEIKERLGEHDVQLNVIYDAMENLLDEKAALRKWRERKESGLKLLNRILNRTRVRRNKRKIELQKLET